MGPGIFFFFKVQKYNFICIFAHVMKKIYSKNSIKSIIFDLGGVIVDIDFNKAIEAFTRLGARNFDQLFSHIQQVNLFDRMDRGEVSPAGFRDELRSIAGLTITDEQFDNAWHSMIMGVPHSRLQLLEDARKNYNTYLLSNTNAIHMETFGQRLQEEYGVEGIKTFFDKSYLSYEVGMRKPERRIFELVVKDNGLDVSETLFIDDTQQHIESAAALGINTYLFRPGEERLEDLFENGFLK